MTEIDWRRAITGARTVAVVGASADRGKVGGRPIDLMMRFGFTGTIYPVNPARDEVQGLSCYPSVRALPQTPDLAIIAVPASQVLDAVEDCGAAGVPVAVVFSSGFRETGAEGAAIEARVLAAARRTGLRLLGPNCQGIANFSNGLVANFSTTFYDVVPQDGPIAIISQSGALAQVLYGAVRAQGLGVRYVMTTGNQADLTLTDLVENAVDDPDVGLVLMYLESVVASDRLAAAAVRAHARGVPLVAVKSGRTVGGQRAALSHTGALATEDRVVDAFMRKYGIQRVGGTYELVRHARWLLEQHRPTGRRLFFLSNSGASCVMASDQAEARQMVMEDLNAEAHAALHRVLPPHVKPQNPLDISTLLMSHHTALSEALASVRQCVQADASVIALPVMGVGYDLDDIAEAVASHRDACGHALAVVSTHPHLQAALRSRGVVVFEHEAAAIDALASLLDQADLARLPSPQDKAPPDDLPAAPAGTAVLNESQALDFLHAAGLQVIPHRLCVDSAQARAAYEAFNAPVAVKGCSRDVAHKTEWGLVALNVSDAQAVVACFARQEEILRQRGVCFDGVLVAPMQRGGVEMVLGARWDPTFGAVVMVGAGGIHVENDADVALLLPSFNAEQVRAAIAGLRIAPVLNGARGQALRDVDAVARLAVRLGDAICAWGGQVTAVDCNPVFVFESGQGARVADAWVVLADPGSSERKGGVLQACS